MKITKQKTSISFITPSRDVLEVKGKLMYSEGDRAWNLLRLKKEMLFEFPNLKNKQENFVYLMKMHRSFDDLKKEIKELEKNDEAVPIMFLIGKEK